MKYRISIDEFLVYLLALTLPMPILQVHRVTISLILLVLFILISCFRTKIFMKGNRTLCFCLFLALLAIINIPVCLFSDLGSKWKLAGIFNVVTFLIAMIFGILVVDNVELKYSHAFISGIKCGCITNVFWCYFQLLMFHVFRVDVNDLIFNQLLKFVKIASASRNGAYCVTGLAWHPAQLVPIVVITYCMFNKIWIHFLLLGICFLSHNTTCLIAGMLCVVMSVIFKRKVIITRKKVLVTCGVTLGAGIVIMFFSYNNILKIWEIVESTYRRFYTILFAFESVDTSSSVHVGYYTLLPKVLDNLRIPQILFGIGYECSGYPYSILTGLYSYLNDWIPESDYINFLIGRGIIWSFSFLFFLIYLIKKGRKISYKYVIFFVVMLICGIMYNVQFWWVIIFELFLSTSIQRNKDVWNV